MDKSFFNVKSYQTITMLAVLLALTWLLLLTVLCFTPFWVCQIHWPLSISEIWKPALFVFAILFFVAVLVLVADLFVIQVLIPKERRFQIIELIVIGSVVATLPRIFWGFVEGQGFEALAPQVEYLPFTLSGGIFIVFLARLTKSNQHKSGAGDVPRLE